MEDFFSRQPVRDRLYVGESITNVPTLVEDPLGPNSNRVLSVKVVRCHNYVVVVIFTVPSTVVNARNMSD